MRGAKGEAVLLVLRTLGNKADAVGSDRPKGKNARFITSWHFIYVIDLSLISFVSGRFYE
jgi:hypothetical protein